MTWIVGRLLALGLSQGRAEKVAPWAVAALLFVSAAAGGLLWLHFHDRQVVAHATDKGNVDQLQHQVKADAKAADQRLKDAAAQTQQQEAYRDAIDKPKPGDAVDPDVRLACEQLRRSGQDTTRLPACGGR